MNDNRTLHKHDENVDSITIAQTYISVGISIDIDLAKDKNSPSITTQSDDYSTGSMNSGLVRALVKSALQSRVKYRQPTFQPQLMSQLSQ